MSNSIPAGSRSAKQRLRALLTNLAVVLVALVVSLGGAEILLRADPSLIDIQLLTRFHADLRSPIATRLGFATRQERVEITSEERTDGGQPFYIYRPDLLYVGLADEEDLKVGAITEIRIDGKGFCNPLEKASRDAVDIVLLGDSFTVCTLVDPSDTFSAYIEEQTGLSTYNLGVNSMGPYENVELLRKFGLALNPKLVVMNIYEGNDMRDMLKYLKFVTHGASKPNRTSTGGLFAVSYALAYLKAGIELTRKRIKKLRRINFRYSVDVQGTRTPMNVSNNDTDEIKHARRIESGDISVDMYGPPLEAFVALATEHGFIPVVTSLPSAHTAYRDSVIFEDEAIGREAAQFARVQREWLAGNADRIGYRFVDVLPAFIEKAPSRPVTFFPSNVHFTRDGHSIVAEILGPELQKMVDGQ